MVISTPASPWTLIVRCASWGNAELTEHLQKNYGIRDVIINPLGEWTGGPDVDCGATNRKLGSDMGDGVTGTRWWPCRA